MSLNDALWNLYLIDQQVRGLENRLRASKRREHAQQVKLQEIEQEREHLNHQLKENHASVANLENEVNTLDQRVEQYRRQMNSAKTNKEYSSLLVEMNTLKTKKSKVEEQALERMTRADALRQETAAMEQKVQEQTQNHQKARDQLEQRQAEVGDRLDALKEQRAEAAAEVPPEPLAIFERLAETLDGEAMAPVIEADRRNSEFSCGGCYMQLPMERVNQLISRDTLVRCDSCHRILYLEPELREAMSANE